MSQAEPSHGLADRLDLAGQIRAKAVGLRLEPPEHRPREERLAPQEVPVVGILRRRADSH